MQLPILKDGSQFNGGDLIMAKIQTTAVTISYNGPFTSCQTAPFFFSQTTRNIALSQPATKSEEPVALGRASASEPTTAEGNVV